MAKEPYIITAKDIAEYHRNKERRHPFYKDSCDLYNKLNVHFTGKFPGEIITDRRPGESEEIKDFRKKYFICNTKPTVMRVFNSAQKIRKSPDWILSFNKEALPSKILPEQSPESYINREYPEHQSLTNWAFSILLMQMMIDANAFELTLPKSIDIANTELPSPVSVIFNSPNVYDYIADEFYVLKANEINYFGKNKANGAVYYSVNSQHITRWIQTSDTIFSEDYLYEHKCTTIPVTQLRGIVTDYNSENILCESRIQSMVPFLTEALREYSDLAGLKLYQCAPKAYAYQQDSCSECEGNRYIKTTDAAGVSEKVICPKCKGKGKFPMNTFDISILRPQTADEQPLPDIPFGYVTPPVEGLAFMESSVEKHYYNALAAINMQDMADVPAVNSGIAKQVDRQDQENWMHSLAEDVIRVMDRVALNTATMRYGYMLNYDYKKIKELVPNINVPEKFDLVSAQTMVQDITQLKTSGAHPALFNNAQIDLAAKLFPSSPEIKKKFETIIALDPLSGLASDEIFSATTSGYISDISATVHFNITEYLEQAIAADNKFFELDRPMQMKILIGFAQKEIEDKAAKDALLMKTAQESAINTNPINGGG